MNAIKELISEFNNMCGRSHTEMGNAAFAELDELEAIAKAAREVEVIVKKAQIKLRSTQRNWDEDCLFEADEELTKAIELLKAGEK